MQDERIDYRWEKILRSVVSTRGGTYAAAAAWVITRPCYGGELPASELEAIRATAEALDASPSGRGSRR